MSGKKEDKPKLPVPVKKARIETETTKATHEEIVAQLVEIGIEPFADPAKKTVAQLEDDIRELVRKDLSVECELAANLYHVQTEGIPERMGYSFNDWVRQREGYGAEKARGLVEIWKNVIKVVNSPVKTLKGMSWIKVKILLPGIKADKINRRNIETWLEFCTIGKPKSVEPPVLEKMVKDLLAKSAKDDMDETMRVVKFSIHGYELDTKNQFLEVAKSALKTESEGVCWMTAAQEFAANHATAADAQIWKARGMLAMKETIESISNGKVAVLYYPIDPTVIPEDLQGVLPFTKIFQGYFDKEGDGVRELGFVIASSEAEAKQILGVKEVREFKVTIAPSFAPKPAPMFTEPPKKAKKGKKGDEKNGEKKESKTDVTWNKTRVEKIMKMSADEVKESIPKLVDELGVSRDDFHAKKEEFKKSTIDGLNTGQCILYWLMEIKETKDAGKK